MNGYFQLLSDNNGISLCIYPPSDEEGEKVNRSDVTFYLQTMGIAFDFMEFNKAIGDLNLLDDKKIIPISEVPLLTPKDESISVKPSVDSMSAVARFYPPSNGGSLITKADILGKLVKEGIKYGIDEDAIDSFLNKRQYCTDYIVARGKAVRNGHDSSIEYFFNTDLKVRPTLKTDGSVDFFNLNTVNHCKKGDVLAKLTKEDAGDTGVSVLGVQVKPRDVKKLKLQFSNNIELSEDKTTITALVNGHVCLVENKVFVSNIYEVENVDNSTGNIDYAGSVLVSGNVCSNFHVKAEGDIEVRGVVEGAYLEAGGDIIIARGVNGMSKGELKAKGNIIAKFLENVNAEAGGYVEAGSIIHSKVMANTEINVSGKRGFITGGTVSASNSINVKNLGSPMGADTIVELGINPQLKAEFQELQKELLEINKVLKSIEPIISSASQKLAKGEKLPPDKMKYIQTLANTSKQKAARYMQVNAKLKEMQGMLDSNTNAKVTVSGEVYSGTKIIIADVAMTVKETRGFCTFSKIEGEIKINTL